MNNIIHKDYQIRLMKEIVYELQNSDKALLLALCGCGKTIMTLQQTNVWVTLGKRVAISTYDMVDIRKQWVETIIEFEEFKNLKNNLQVVCAKSDVKKYKKLGIRAVTSSEIDKETLLTVFIPSTITPLVDLGNFDFFVIDEAHENLDTKKDEGRLQTIIKRFSKPTTKYLGLSGTGFDMFKEKRSFFYGSNPVIYDLKDGLIDGAINNGKIIAEKFDIGLSAECYNNDKELNRKGIAKLRNLGLNNLGSKTFNNKKVFELKLELLIKEVVGKTLVVVPKGLNCEQEIANFICNIIGDKNAAVVNTSKIHKYIATKNEIAFRSKTSTTNFMIVVDKCGTGWDFKSLNNVIDLTFTKNFKVIIQRFARAIRLDADKPTSKYFYCYDQRISHTKVDVILGTVISLMTKEGILASKTTSKTSLRIPKKVSTAIKERLEITIDVQNINSFIDCIKTTTYSWTLSDVLEKEKNEPTKKRLKDIFEFHDKNKNYPSLTSSDHIEKKLGADLRFFRHMKKETPWIQTFAEEQGHPNALNNISERTLIDINLIIDFYHKNERYPSSRSSDSIEAKLGKKLERLRQAKRKNTTSWSDEYQKQAEQRNCNDMFEIKYSDFKLQKKKDLLSSIAEFTQKNERYPSSKSSDPIEAKLGRELIRFRQSKKGNVKNKWATELQTHADKIGLHDALDISISLSKFTINS